MLVALVLWAAFEAPTRAGNWTLALGGSIRAAAALLYGVVSVSRAEDQPAGAVTDRHRDACAAEVADLFGSGALQLEQ